MASITIQTVSVPFDMFTGTSSQIETLPEAIRVYFPHWRHFSQGVSHYSSSKKAFCLLTGFCNAGFFRISMTHAVFSILGHWSCGFSSGVVLLVCQKVSTSEVEVSCVFSEFHN